MTHSPQNSPKNAKTRQEDANVMIQKQTLQQHCNDTAAALQQHCKKHGNLQFQQE